MAINTIDQYIAAAKQKIPIVKTATRTTVAIVEFSLFDIAGTPGAGTLAGSSTASGVVPTDATPGCPVINAFNGAAVGYLTGIEFYNTVASRVKIYDMLFKAGAYAFTGQTNTLNTQPAISSRCPDYPGSGSVFGAGNEIWIEVTAAFVTGNNWQVQVTYTNSAGTTGRTSIISAAQAAAALTQGKMFIMALQAGDSGVQKIESVIVTNGITAMTAGNFNVLILRPLISAKLAATGYQRMNILDSGAPVVYTDSAIIMTVQPDSTSTGLPDVLLEIANG